MWTGCTLSQDQSLRAQIPMTSVLDITDTEQWVIKTPLRERYGRERAFQLADAEIRPHPSERELNRCPAIVWQSDGGCTFAIFKGGERKYHCKLSYKPYKQMGTGIEEYDDLAEYAVAVLQAQADDVAERRGDLPGKNG